MSEMSKNSFLYGGLNQKVEQARYEGLSTTTTTTHVDNINNTISVDANIDVTKVEQELTEVRLKFTSITTLFVNIQQLLSNLEIKTGLLNSAVDELQRSLQQNMLEIYTTIAEEDIKLQEEITTQCNSIKEQLTTVDISLQSQISSISKIINQTIAPKIYLIEGQLSTLSQAVAQLQSKVNKKAEALYYDSTGKYDSQRRKYWYLASDINNPENSLLKDAQGNYVPYDFNLPTNNGETCSLSFKDINWPADLTQGSNQTLTINWTSQRGANQDSGTLQVSVDDALTILQKLVPNALN